MARGGRAVDCERRGLIDVSSKKTGASHCERTSLLHLRLVAFFSGAKQIALTTEQPSQTVRAPSGTDRAPSGPDETGELPRAIAQLSSLLARLPIAGTGQAPPRYEEE